MKLNVESLSISQCYNITRLTYIFLGSIEETIAQGIVTKGVVVKTLLDELGWEKYKSLVNDYCILQCQDKSACVD